MYGYTLEQASYSKWAAEELLTLLYANRGSPPLPIFEGFRDKLKALASVNPRTAYIFETASYAVDCLVDMLISS